MYRKPIYPAHSKKNLQSPPQIDMSPQKHALFNSLSKIMVLLLQENLKKKMKNSFTTIKVQADRTKKTSYYLARRINHFFLKKQRSVKKEFISRLITIKIQFYNQQAQKHKEFQVSTRNSAARAWLHILQKIYKKKFANSFFQLKEKINQIHKLNRYRVTFLSAKLKKIQRTRLQEGLRKIVVIGVSVRSSQRLCHKIQLFLSSKNNSNLSSSFNILRLNLYRKRLGTKEPIQAKENAAIGQNRKEQVKQVRSQLQQRANSLRRQLESLEKESTKQQSAAKTEISNLQKENESLKFNNQILDQKNRELEQQYLNKQKKSRKKISASEVWENIYNNLIYFLAANRGKTVSKESLLQCLETPLVPCGSNLQEVQEENNDLENLLHQYQQHFLEPPGIDESAVEVPYQILKKQNRYYFMVLEVLAEWGLSGSKELEQLNSDLESLQKRVSEN